MCGIYGLYWIYKLTEDVNTLKGDPNATSGGIVILLGIITCGIYMWYWLYTTSTRSRHPVDCLPETAAFCI